MATKVKDSADPVELLSAAFTDPATGQELTRQLGKAVLSKGAWATVLFLIQDYDVAKKNWRGPKISVRRYKRAGQTYRFHSAFSISGEKQARAIIDAVQGWFGPGGAGRVALDALGDHAESDDE